MSHTFAILEISALAYSEIADKLRAAGHDHAFDVQTGAIDMQGLAIMPSWVDIEAAAKALVERAARQNTVLTIEQRSVPPLAQGRYETIVSVREVRRG